MAKDRNGSVPEEDGGDQEDSAPSKRDRHRKSKRNNSGDGDSSDSGDGDKKRRRRRRRRSSKSGSRRRRSDSEDEDSDSDSDSDSFSGNSGGESVSESSGSDSERRRKRKERRRRREREYEREKLRRRERKRKERERMKKKEKKDKKRKKDKGGAAKGAVTNSWGKYGIIRETDMWNKRPEFTAWLSEVKQVNLETLANWEEKQMFKEFMEDHNTATFPSKKYYSLDAYHQRQMEKEMKSSKKVKQTERTVFNDEEQRRQELQMLREKQKEEQVEALKSSMQSGMAQAMKEQARLREEMAYQYRLGNFEAAAAIQKRLDPDAV